MTDIVTKLWGFCHTLRHDGIDYGDYIEQLTYCSKLYTFSLPSSWTYLLASEDESTESLICPSHARPR